MQLQLIYEAVRKAQADDQWEHRVMPDVAFFAKQAIQFLVNTAAQLRRLQAEHSAHSLVPPLFPQVRPANLSCLPASPPRHACCRRSHRRSCLQVWTAVAALAIASTLACTLPAGPSSPVAGAEAAGEDEVPVTSAAPPDITSAPSDPSSTDSSFQRLLPYHVAPGKLVEALEAADLLSGLTARSSAAGGESSHATRVHQMVAEALTSAYVVRHTVAAAKPLQFCKVLAHPPTRHADERRHS